MSLSDTLQLILVLIALIDLVVKLTKNQQKK